MRGIRQIDMGSVEVALAQLSGYYYLFTFSPQAWTASDYSGFDSSWYLFFYGRHTVVTEILFDVRYRAIYTFHEIISFS